MKGMPATIWELWSVRKGQNLDHSRICNNKNDRRAPFSCSKLVIAELRKGERCVVNMQTKRTQQGAEFAMRLKTSEVRPQRIVNNVEMIEILLCTIDCWELQNYRSLKCDAEMLDGDWASNRPEFLIRPKTMGVRPQRIFGDGNNRNAAVHHWMLRSAEFWIFEMGNREAGRWSNESLSRIFNPSEKYGTSTTKDLWQWQEYGIWFLLVEARNCRIMET